MHYLLWAIIALVCYTVVAPLVSIAMRDIPSTVVALITNLFLVAGAFGVVVYNGQSLTAYFDHAKMPYMVIAGIFLTIGILAYYRALSLGPVSVVVPVFGLFVATSSIIGIAFLNESLTARKVAGIGFAVLAIYLTSVE